MDGTCSTLGTDEKCKQSCSRKTPRPLEKRGDNIKLNLKETG